MRYELLAVITTDESVILAPCTDVLPEEADAILAALDTELKSSPAPGIGLAAAQIGIHKRAFIIRTGTSHGTQDFINPRILSLKEPIIFQKEGCLSYPLRFLRTLRYNRIIIADALCPAGQELIGLEAIVAQHEYQHTVGKSMFESQLSMIAPNHICPCNSGQTFHRCCQPTLIKNMRIF